MAQVFQTVNDKAGKPEKEEGVEQQRQDEGKEDRPPIPQEIADLLEGDPPDQEVVFAGVALQSVIHEGQEDLFQVAAGSQLLEFRNRVWMPCALARSE